MTLLNYHQDGGCRVGQYATRRFAGHRSAAKRAKGPGRLYQLDVFARNRAVRRKVLDNYKPAFCSDDLLFPFKAGS